MSSTRRYQPNNRLKERRGKEEYFCIIVLFPVPEDEFRSEDRMADQNTQCESVTYDFERTREEAMEALVSRKY